VILKKEKILETTVAALLLVTSTVVFACLVIDYAVTIMQQTLNTENIPQLSRIRNLESSILNHTDNLFNQTLPELPSQLMP
jgi:hypothetical protein